MEDKIQEVMYRSAQSLHYYVTIGIIVLAGSRLYRAWRGGVLVGSQEWLLVLALAVPRLLLFVSLPLNGNERGGDALLYLRVAQAFPSSHLTQAPGYSYLLGMVLRFLSGGYLVDSYVVALLQSVLGIATAVLLFRWIRTYSGTQAWLAALGWGLFAPTMFSEHVTRPEFLVTLFLVSLVYVVDRYRAGGERDNGLLYWAGLLSGWAILTRVNSASVIGMLLVYMFFASGKGVRDRVVACLKVAFPAVLVYFTFSLLVHFPATRTTQINWGLVGNLGGLVGKRLNTIDNPHVRDFIEFHHDLGAYLRHRQANGERLEDLIPFSPDPKVLTRSPELDLQRAAFTRFREGVNDTDIAHTDWTQLYDFYEGVPHREYLFGEGGYYYGGFIEVYNMITRPTFYAIRNYPWEYVVEVAKRMPQVFFFDRGFTNEIGSYLSPPTADEVRVIRTLPLWIDIGARHSHGLFWWPGIHLLRYYGLLCVTIVYLMAMVVPLGLAVGAVAHLAGKCQIPHQVLLGSLVFLSYLPIVAAGVGYGRLFIPIYPFLFQLLAFAVGQGLRSSRCSQSLRSSGSRIWGTICASTRRCCTTRPGC